IKDSGTHCEHDVFDDPVEARRHHRRGLCRLFRLGMRDQVKVLEKNIPDLTRMSMLYMNLGTQEDLRDQIIDCAIAQAFLGDPWPQDQAGFEQRKAEGRNRLGLIVQEIARLAGSILTEWAALMKKMPQ